MRKDKHRDIARGVLPSTARKGARDNKRNFHAKNRHAQRQAVHAIERSLATITEDGTLAHDLDLFDDFEGQDVIDGYAASTKPTGCSYDHDMAYIVARRRDADNLGPLYSWAEGVERQKMAGWTVEDKYAYFKAVLPDTLQGRHALGHIEQHLGLSNDEFSYGWYRRPDPITVETFRAALDRCLATTKSRQRLRDFLYETVPVAAHSKPTNNKRIERQQARDENGMPRVYTSTIREWDPLSQRRVTIAQEHPVMVDVAIPQMVATTCDDCSFLRNDPLATVEAINRFVALVWGRKRSTFPSNYYLDRRRAYEHHPFLREIRDYVLAQR